MTNIRNWAIGGAAAFVAASAAMTVQDVDVRFESLEAAPIECALVIDGTLSRTETFDTACPPDPAGKPTFDWMPVTRNAQPSYDTATENLTGTQGVVGEAYVYGWQITPKPASEIDADNVISGDTLQTGADTRASDAEKKNLVDLVDAVSDAPTKAALKALLSYLNITD